MRRVHYGWVVVACAGMAVLLSAGVRAAPAVFLLPIEEDLGISRSTVSLAISLGLILCGLAVPISGKLNERYGPRLVATRRDGGDRWRDGFVGAEPQRAPAQPLLRGLERDRHRSHRLGPGGDPRYPPPAAARSDEKRLIIVLLALIAACGGGVEATTSAGTSPPSPTTTTVVDSVVTVFWSLESETDCSLVAGYERTVDAETDPKRAAFELLSAGPTPEEEADGAWSFFSGATAGSLRGVSLGQGVLTVDFSNFAARMPNASTSCGSAALLAQVTTTAFQFEEVERVAYTFEGSCEDFGAFLQSGCIEIGRNEWPPTSTGLGEFRVDPSNPAALEALPGSADAHGSGCSPGAGPLSDGIWFGSVIAADEASVEFDLACFFVGEAANEAAAEDGVEEIPVPNDYYIRNRVSELRTISVHPGAVAYSLKGAVEYEQVAWGDWPTGESFLTCPGESCIVWLYVNDGSVSEMVEQYTP